MPGAEGGWNADAWPVEASPDSSYGRGLNEEQAEQALSAVPPGFRRVPTDL